MKRFIKQYFSQKINKNLPIVFFDRDGVILKNRDFLLNKKDIVFYNSAIKALQLLNSYNIPVVIITNQPGVARGWISESDLKEINKEVAKLLATRNAFIYAIYSCPHHPQGDLLEYRANCKCRKPGTLLLEDALKESNNKINNCYIIGDKTTDIQAGKNMGIKTILVKTGYAGQDKICKAAPDYTCTNALQAVKKILNDFNL